MECWLLLVEAGTEEQAGVARGQTRRLSVEPSSRGGPGDGFEVRGLYTADQLFESAVRGGQIGYRLLWSENHLRERLTVRFDLPGLDMPVAGRSAELLFALAVITEAYQVRADIPVVAATGRLADDGSVLPVAGVAAKVRSALESLPPHSRIFYPMANFGEVDAQLQSLADTRRVLLWPVDSLAEAAIQLGIPVLRAGKEPPYRGLESFEYRHRALYFGRSTDVAALYWHLLRREMAGNPGALVIAPSGAGKSSFVQAGVMSALTVGPTALRDKVLLWRAWRPRHALGRDQAALAESIRHSWKTLTGFAVLQHVPAMTSLAQLLEHLPDELRQRRQRLIWIVDQFEELFQLDFDRSAIAACADFLEKLQRLGIWVIVSLRADFYAQYQEQGALLRMFAGDGLFNLPHMDNAALSQVIQGPALAAGLSFDVDANGTGLAARLLSEMNEPHSLPLLQCALNLLYQRRDIARRCMTFQAYAEIDGLRGAISHAADHVFTSVDANARDCWPGVLRKLADLPPGRNGKDDRSDESGARIQPVARVADLADWPPGSPERRLVEALMAGRLLIGVRDDSGKDRRGQVRVVHEALLTHWPVARRQLEQDSADLQARTRLEDAWRRWEANPDKAHQLPLAGAALTEALSLLQRRGDELAAGLREFIGMAADLARRWQRTQDQARQRWRYLAASFALAVIILTGLSARLWQRSEHSEDKRQEQAASADFISAGRERIADRSPRALAYLARSVRQSPDDGIARLALLLLLDELAWTELLPSRIMQHLGEVRGTAFSPDGTRIATTSSDSTAQLWNAASGERIGSPLQHPAAVTMVSFSPDGRYVATAAMDNLARVWRTETGTLEFSFKHRHFLPDNPTEAETRRMINGQVWSVTFNPDSRQVLTASADQTARVWSLSKDSEATLTLVQEGSLRYASYSPDGSRIVTAAQSPMDELGMPDMVTMGVPEAIGMPELAALGLPAPPVPAKQIGPIGQIWDAHSGKRIGSPLRHSGSVISARNSDGSRKAITVPSGVVLMAAFSADGSRVVTAGSDQTARIWDGHTGAAIGVPLKHEGMVFRAVFSPDGRYIATASDDHTARLWDASGKAIGAPLPHTGTVLSGSFSPDSQYVVTASVDDTARVWNASSATPASPGLPHADGVLNASFSPDGNRIVTGSKDRLARIWHRREPIFSAESRRYSSKVRCASPLGDRVLTWHHELRDVRSGAAINAPLLRKSAVISCSFSPDGRLVATGSNQKSARIWDAATGAPLTAPLSHDNDVASVNFSANGKRLVTRTREGTAHVWNTESGTLAGPMIPVQAMQSFAQLDADGGRVIAGPYDTAAQIWDVATGRELGPLLPHKEMPTNARFSHDGKLVVTTSFDFTARIWDAQSGQPVSPELVHQSTVLGAQFSREGDRLVTFSHDRTARLWDVRTGAAIGEPLQHADAVSHASFSPDGSLVMTASDDRTARLWDARTGAPVSGPLRHPDEILLAFFSADGNQVFTASEDDMSRMWTLPKVDTREAMELAEFAETVAGMAVSQRDIVEPLADRPAAVDRLRQRVTPVADSKDSDLHRVMRGHLLPAAR